MLVALPPNPIYMAPSIQQSGSSENSGFAVNSTVAGSAQFFGKFLSTCKETSSLLIGPSIRISPSGTSPFAMPWKGVEGGRGREIEIETETETHTRGKGDTGEGSEVIILVG